MNELPVYLGRLLPSSVLRDTVLIIRKKEGIIHVNYMLTLKPIPRHISIYKNIIYFLTWQVKDQKVLILQSPDLPGDEK